MAQLITDADLVAQIVERSGSIHAAEAVLVIGRKLQRIRELEARRAELKIANADIAASTASIADKLGALAAIESCADNIGALTGELVALVAP